MTIGTLTDDQIRDCCQRGELISDGFNPKNIRQACYELTLGDVYFDLTEGDKRYSTQDQNNALIKPGHLVVLITKEKLKIPNDVICRIASKGSLFSCGLMPVSTYADPGFSGNIGIVTYNLSRKYVQLPAGEPIAKIEFSKLENPVHSPYTGQHGFETDIWPIKHHFLQEFSDIKHDPRAHNELDEAAFSLPPIISRGLNNIFRYQRTLYLFMGLLMIMNLVIMGAYKKDLWDPMYNIIIGVIGNAVFTAIGYYATRIEK